MGVLHEGWASARITGDTASSIVDLPPTAMTGGDLVSVPAWYDNDAGYSMRLAEAAAALSGVPQR